jgi:DNA-binding CsgD family transcriptional regulator
VTVTRRHLVGREEELGAILALLDVSDELPVTAVLTGDAGIGKTTLWLAAIDAARARGYRVLSCRPSEAETESSFISLADLLGDVAGDVLPELPPVQRRALEAALLLGETQPASDDRAVASAFLGALRVLARDGPVCLAVDDVQWLDAASLVALRFALARLEEVPVAAVLAVRGDTPSWVRRAVPLDEQRTVDVGPLSVGATRELIQAALDATFPRPTLLRIWETSGGNPLFALELAAALQRRGGTLVAGDELPIPSNLDELLRGRVDELDDDALQVARIVAALAEPTATVVGAVVGPRFEAGLDGGVRARILELDGDRLRFTHPLLRSAVAARETPSNRRSIHAHLAGVVVDPEQRARHLALATVEPDDDVAEALEGAARAASARGAPAAAADLAAQALRLTPASRLVYARRRLFGAAELLHRAGDGDRARALLDEACESAAPGNDRAAILAQRAQVEEHPQRRLDLFRQALAEVEHDDSLHAVIQLGLADVMGLTDGIERGVEHAELAVLAASRVDDDVLRCRAVAAYGHVHFASGHGIARKALDEAIVLERSLPGWPLPYGPTGSLGYQLCWSADVDNARPLYEELLAVARERNDPILEQGVLWHQAHIEWRAGNWEAADRLALGSVDLRSQLGPLLPPDEFPAAFVAAHIGRTDEARTRARRALANAEAEEVGIGQSGHSWVLGFVDLSLGDAEAALTHLRRSYGLRNKFMLEPAQRLELGDLLEALITVGEFDEAQQILGVWQPRADALDRAWALAILARSRGLLLAARGDAEGALASFERALAEHARSADPFQRARTLLALGRTQRRAKKRGAARTTLEEALAEFDRVGAPLWAEQARTELTRISGRAPSSGELTEAERRIADLVAEGHTNREVAAALFLTEHSVETALTRVYRKLGLRSRAELARLLAPKT